MKKSSNMLNYSINIALISLFLFLGNRLVTVNKLFTRAQTTVILQIGIYVIIAVALNVIMGYLGQLSLGQSGFIAIGAYSSALYWKAHPTLSVSNFIIGIFIGALFSSVAGFLVSMSSFKLKGDYLAIITLGFSEIVRVFLINISKITGGAQGLKSIPKYSNFLTVYMTTIVCCTIVHLIMKSKFGRAIRSIGQNEIASMASGINVKFYKSLAFIMSAALSGIAGGLYATNQGIITPNEFSFLKSIDAIVMVVLGGTGSMFGSVVSAVFLTALPLFLQSVLKNFNDYRMMIYSIVLIFIMMFKPTGIFGTYDFSLSRIINRWFFASSRGENNG